MAQLVGEAAVDLLLQEQARRQAVVDRLVGNSTWDRVAGTQLLPIALGSLSAVAVSLWPGDSRWLQYAASLGLVGVFGLTIQLVQVTRQLQAVTSVLKETGALTAFIERSTPRLVGQAGSNPQPDSAPA
jgi:hypothetical protein